MIFDASVVAEEDLVTGVTILALSGLVGIVVGGLLNLVIDRVPSRIPLAREIRCPSCQTRVPPSRRLPMLSWLMGRGVCASCGARISIRYPLVELATGTAFVGVVWICGRTNAFHFASAGERPIILVLVTLAYLYLACISIVLSLIDLDTHRLPDVIVVPSAAVLAGVFTLVCLISGECHALVRAALAGAALFTFYWSLRLIRSGGMGGGDVKLAGVLGLALGWIGWEAVIVGAFAGFIVGGAVALVLMLAGRATRETAIPFGPFMIIGAWIGITLGPQLAGG